MIDKTLMTMSGIKRIMSLLAGLAVLQALFIIGQAYFLARAIAGLWNGHALTVQLSSLAIFFLCYFLRQAVVFFREKILDEYAAKQAGLMREKLLQKVFLLGPAVVQENGTGNMVTMALEGIHQTENYLHLILAKMMNMMIIPWLILIFIFTLDRRSGVILLIVFPIIILFMIILGYAAQAKADKQYAAFQVLSNHFIDSLSGLATLKLFGLSKKYATSIYQTSERFRQATMSTLKFAILSTFALDFFTTLSVAIVAVFLGFRLLNGEVFLFPALTALILAPEFFLPLRDFAGDYHATLDGKNALQAIQKVLIMPETENRTELSLSQWQESSELKIDHLNFRYSTETDFSLTDITFQTQGYQKIGIIGASGSGKSTLVNLLSGFLQSVQNEKADIRIDQQKISHLAQNDWQKQLLYIPQDPYIFHETLANNVRFYEPAADDRQVLAALKVAGLEALINDLPQGINTLIGESGRTLSGGQAQRVVLARAFLDQKRKILLFDEPTAHLDLETEIELKQNMLPLMENRLVFFATHRLHWMSEMDFILVLDHGRIVEAGTLEELQQQQGFYVQLTQEMRGGKQ